MKKIIVALVLTMAFCWVIGAASATVITGSQSYSFMDDSEGWFNAFSSGSNQDLQIGGKTTATSNVNNIQTLLLDPAYVALQDPVITQQYGATKLTLNNYQEAGQLQNNIKDFQFESSQGCVVEFKSEGIDSAFSQMGGSAYAVSNDLTDNILIHDLWFINYNGCYATAEGNNAEIKHGVFNRDAVSAANIVMQDSMIEHADVAVGISIGAYAEGKIQPGFDIGEIHTFGEFVQYGNLYLTG